MLLCLHQTPPHTPLAQQEVLINVAPKKANWELRRAIAPQLAKLDRRTQEAMITLMKAEQASAAAV